MSKVRPHRSSPTLDMTPMVDLAFLLVTFFMLTTKFAADEPVPVDTPSSVSEIKIPDTNVLTIMVSKDGLVYFNMDGQYNRADVLQKMGTKYGVEFDKTEQHSFAVIGSSIGIPMGSMKQFLDLGPEDRKLVKQTGIPIDSLHNELADWVLESRLTNRMLRIAIKGDRDSDFPTIKKVIKTLIDKKVNRFNLITNMERPS
jgi:biopolymer transport protein ExbD